MPTPAARSFGSVAALTAGLICLWLLVYAAAPAGARAADASTSLSPSNYRVSALCGEPQPGFAGCFGLRLAPRHPLALPGARSKGASAPEAVGQEATAGQGGSSSGSGSSSGGDSNSEGGSAAEAVSTASESTPSLQKIEFTQPRGFSPHTLSSVYGLTGSQAQSSNQTIALVDAYDDPTVQADLTHFDQQFGLPECTEANGCFTKVKLGSPPKEAGWALEIATDVEVAHGICPHCKILLVEAHSNSNSDLEAAEAKAESLGANEISDSWGGPELGASVEADASGPYNHPGTVITAAAGDNGYLDWDSEESGYADYPASSPHVVAVGGTRLEVQGESRAAETVWNGNGAGGGGCSEIFSAPAWQQATAGFAAVGCGSHRAVADVAADGDPFTGVPVYDSTWVTEEGKEYRGWFTLGGTSVASPIIAAGFALAGGAGTTTSGSAVQYPAQTLYENLASNPGSLYDVTTGSNGACEFGFDESTGLAECSLQEEGESCAGARICVSGSGYDGPSGVGTPNGIAAFKAPAQSSAAAIVGGSAQPAASGAGGGSSGGSSSGGNSGSRPATATHAVVISALSLTRSALSALRHLRPRFTQLGFAFTLSRAATVRVSLSRLTRVHGFETWRALAPAAVSLSAPRGRNSSRLHERGTLRPGSYRLTLTPAGGSARSLVFRIA